MQGMNKIVIKMRLFLLFHVCSVVQCAQFWFQENLASLKAFASSAINFDMIENVLGGTEPKMIFESNEIVKDVQKKYKECVPDERFHSRSVFNSAISYLMEQLMSIKRCYEGFEVDEDTKALIMKQLAHQELYAEAWIRFKNAEDAARLDEEADEEPSLNFALEQSLKIQDDLMDELSSSSQDSTSENNITCGEEDTIVLDNPLFVFLRMFGYVGRVVISSTEALLELEEINYDAIVIDVDAMKDLTQLSTFRGEKPFFLKSNLSEESLRKITAAPFLHPNVIGIISNIYIQDERRIPEDYSEFLENFPQLQIIELRGTNGVVIQLKFSQNRIKRALQ